MDGLTLAASAVELKKLIGGKIEKIQQPEKYELLFAVRISGESLRLFISASPENCRIQLTDEKRTSPIDAPMFLMLLRKHLLGARITGVSQPGLDRIVVISFETLNELRDSTCYTLVCEIMGKHSNVILVDGDGIIVDALRRVSPSMSSVRLVLPRIAYAPPPSQQKMNPATADANSFFAALTANELKRPEKALSEAFSGLSPAIARLLLEYCGFDGSDSMQAAKGLADFYSQLLSGAFRPCIAAIGDKNALLPFVPKGYSCIEFNSIAAAADEFYHTRSENEGVKRRTATLERTIINNIQRLERKIEKFSLSIGDSEGIERLRLYGELLTANMHCIAPRSSAAVVQNYYLDPLQEEVIPLDEMLTPAENAQVYYKKYRKAKSACESALVQREAAETELDYLNGLNADLAKCLTESDLNEIREELVLQGYIKAAGKKGSKAKPVQSKPYRYVSDDGIEISVGKNNTQNDMLTFKRSSPADTWLHTKDIHGSHVIIHCTDEIPPTTLMQAAKLAAYYSQARESSGVAVDYTKRKFVKKPTGAKPGMVIYTNQRTLYVTPERGEIDSMKKFHR